MRPLSTTAFALYLSLAAAMAAPRILRADEVAPLKVGSLKCEYAVDPLGIDLAKPRLFWTLASDARGESQSAWQILASASAEDLAQDKGSLWDSHKVIGEDSTFITYGGLPLTSSERVYWKVRVWDQAGRLSAWSAPAQWTMGIVDADDWKALWICAPGETESLLLRREFTVKPGLKRAIAHVCGLGQYELELNGAKAGKDLLTPGWTNYERAVLYDTRDVTDLLHEGANAVGMFLGNGMYDVIKRDRFVKFTGFSGPLRAFLQLRLEYEDGTVETVLTDRNWKTLSGPIVFGGIYGGEDYDARLLPQGWSKAGFDDSIWLRAVNYLRDREEVRGSSEGDEPVQVIESRLPIGKQAFPDGSVVYDLGQNASTMPRIRVSGPRGSSIRLVPSEIVNPDGTINRSTMGGTGRGNAWWQYTKATDKEETWTPHFAYVGCRYLKVECFAPGEDAFARGDVDETAGEPVGMRAPKKKKSSEAPAAAEEAPPPPPAPKALAYLPGRAKLDQLEGLVVHSTAAPVGEFETSNQRLNRIRTLVRWSMRSNMVSLLTDCPHREKLGWLEQAHLDGPSLRYEYDANRIFRKNVGDMIDSQHADGLMPEIAPEYVKFNGVFATAAEWGAAIYLVPWQQYQFTGDVSLLKLAYEPMRKYFAYLTTKSQGDLLSEGLGDWYDLGPLRPGYAQLTPAEVTASAFYCEDATVLSKIATILGHPDQAQVYVAQAEKTRLAFNKKFFHTQPLGYAGNSQCENAMPLVMGIADPVNRTGVLHAIVADVEKRGDGLTAGDVGFEFFLQALAQGGRSDLIYRIINQDDKPGYAYQLRKGATSLTEAWDANNGASHDHFMLGEITEWFYRDLAGIDCDPDGPGFRKIRIAPSPVGDLTWVQARYDSIHGPISVRWERSGDSFTLKATIPANTTATVIVPSLPGTEVTEGGKSAGDAPGVAFLKQEGDRAYYSVSSGSFVFVSRWAPPAPQSSVTPSTPTSAPAASSNRSS